MTARTARWAAVVVGSALVFTGLGRQNLWLDENMAFDAARGSWGNLGHFFRVFPDQHPLYYLLLRAWLVFGESEFALRSLSAVCVILAIPLIARLASELAGESEGTVAAWVAATSPFLLYYGQEARMYALVLLLATGSSLALARWLKSERRTWLVVYGVVAVAGCYTHFFFTFLVMAQFLAGLAALGWRSPGVRRLLAVQTLVALAYVPWAVNLATTPNTEFEQKWKALANVVFGIPYTLLRFGVGYAIFPNNYGWKQHAAELLKADWPVLGVAAVVFGVAGACGVVRLWRAGGPARMPPVLLVVPMGMALMFSVFTIITSERYLIVCFPFFVVVVAVGIVGLTRGRRAVVGWIAGFGLMGVSVASLVPYYGSPDFGKEQWSEAAALIRSTLRPGDIIFVQRGFVLPAFSRYFKPVGGERVIPEGDTLEARGASRVWLVINREPDEAAYIARWSRGRNLCVDRRFVHLTGIRVVRLDRGACGAGTPETEPSR